jgi:hypothetical protein
MKVKLFLALLVACSPMVYTHDVPNLTQVDYNIWRSGQITTRAGWDWINHLANGRQVYVIKLNFDREGVDGLAVTNGFNVVYLPVQPEGDQDLWDDFLSVWQSPDYRQIDEAEDELAFCLTHTETVFCLVHCTHGQDRTGYVIGVHRVLHDGWTKYAAFKEMQANHFHTELQGLYGAWLMFKGP